MSAGFKANPTLVFGISAMGMGVQSIGLVTVMPAVVFAVVLGTALGLWMDLG